MNTFFKRVVLRQKLKRVPGTIVRKTIMAYEDLKRGGYDCVLKEGYATWGPVGCWHLWIEDPDGNKYDVGQELSKIPVSLVETIPEGTQIMNDPKIDFSSEYKEYLEDPKKYFTKKSSSST